MPDFNAGAAGAFEGLQRALQLIMAMRQAKEERASREHFQGEQLGMQREGLDIQREGLTQERDLAIRKELQDFLSNMQREQGISIDPGAYQHATVAQQRQQEHPGGLGSLLQPNPRQALLDRAAAAATQAGKTPGSSIAFEGGVASSKPPNISTSTIITPGRDNTQGVALVRLYVQGRRDAQRTALQQYKAQFPFGGPEQDQKIIDDAGAQFDQEWEQTQGFIPRISPEMLQRMGIEAQPTAPATQAPGPTQPAAKNLQDYLNVFNR